MARPCKLTQDITKRIGDNIALGLPYSLAAEASGITRQTFNVWIKKGKTEKSGKYFHFINTFKNEMQKLQNTFGTTKNCS
jgi:DNA invertase Pin-like site-specific DNA recombinase